MRTCSQCHQPGHFRNSPKCPLRQLANTASSLNIEARDSIIKNYKTINSKQRRIIYNLLKENSNFSEEMDSKEQFDDLHQKYAILAQVFFTFFTFNKLNANEYMLNFFSNYSNSRKTVLTINPCLKRKRSINGLTKNENLIPQIVQPRVKKLILQSRRSQLQKVGRAVQFAKHIPTISKLYRLQKQRLKKKMEQKKLCQTYPRILQIMNQVFHFKYFYCILFSNFSTMSKKTKIKSRRRHHVQNY